MEAVWTPALSKLSAHATSSCSPAPSLTPARSQASASAFAAPFPLQRDLRPSITSVVSVVGRARGSLLIVSVAAILIQRGG